MDEEQTEIFIELVHENECLWNVTSKAFKNKILRDEIWSNVAKLFGMSGEEAYSTFRSFREKYRREKAKEDAPSGSAVVRPSTWPHMKSLAFLDDVYKKRRVQSSQSWTDCEEVSASPVSNSGNYELPSRSRSRSNTPRKEETLLNAMEENTLALINAIHEASPPRSEHEGVLRFIEHTFKSLNKSDALRYEEMLMKLSMEFKYKTK